MTWMKALKYFLRFAIGLWITGLILTVTFRNDPVIVSCVRTIFVSATGIFTDTREAQKMIWEETKKQMKEQK